MDKHHKHTNSEKDSQFCSSCSEAWLGGHSWPLMAGERGLLSAPTSKVASM